MIISAHPDDDTLVGGTVAALAARGWKVHEFVCTDGSNGKPNARERTAMMANNRRKEIDLFSRDVGMEPPRIRVGGNILLSPTEDIVLELAAYLREVRPDVCILLNRGDYHFEHRAAHAIGLRAIEIAFRSTLLHLGARLEHGIILETDGLNVLANPLILFDISETYAVKMRAMRAAYAERLGRDLLRFDEGLAMLRGGRAKSTYAEAFRIVNPPWYRLTAVSAGILAEFVAIGSPRTP
ncbi:MAG: PIG-L family deacetylase [Candidatus Paceibacterota bacterium]|nr:MAG: PIG-L family deacetylase [Candidatus Paceibacterota bacterium]